MHFSRFIFLLPVLFIGLVQASEPHVEPILPPLTPTDCRMWKSETDSVPLKIVTYIFKAIPEYEPNNPDAISLIFGKINKQCAQTPIH